MKKLAGVLIGVAALMAPSAFAELKIAVINYAQAISQAEEVVEALEVLQAELQPEQDEIRGEQQALLEQREKLATDADILSDEDKQSIASEIDSRTFDLEQQVERFNRNLQRRQQEIQQRMIPKAQAVVADLVAIEGYDFVMERTTLVHVNAKHDITRKVTEKLNEKR